LRWAKRDRERAGGAGASRGRGDCTASGLRRTGAAETRADVAGEEFRTATFAASSATEKPRSLLSARFFGTLPRVSHPPHCRIEIRPRRMRIAIVYDCLYPYTVGGAERRYRSVVAQLAQRHQVTYLTRQQWNQADALEVPAGVRCVAVSRGRRLYNASGRRKISPPLRFGWGIFWHLLRHRRDYDVVH